MHTAKAAGALSALLVWGGALDVAAQDQGPRVQRVAAFHATADSASLASLAEAVDPVFHAQLDALQVADVAARPAVDLAGMQMALDCIGETPLCLGRILGETDTDALATAALHRTGEETVVTLLYFGRDGEDDTAGDLRRVVRRVRARDAARVEQLVLDAMPVMVHELFGLKPPPDDNLLLEPEDDGAADQATDGAPAGGTVFPLGPAVTAAAGLAVLGTGAVFGVLASGTEDDYAALRIDSDRDASRASELLDEGRTQATVANVLFAVGAVTVVGAAVWWALELSEDEAIAFAPVVAPAFQGVALTGVLGVEP